MHNGQLTHMAEQVLHPLDAWEHNCHAASVKLLRSGRFGTCRVARGGCRGVVGQHSWLILSSDAYHERATIIDGTLWSYDDSVSGIWIGSYKDGRHTPHGKGSIWNWGRPEHPIEPPIELMPSEPLSMSAQGFLDVLGPLDYAGWAQLAHAPVQGWPSAEIFSAMEDTPRLAGLVPIDIIGMITERNPGGLYLP